MLLIKLKLWWHQTGRNLGAYKCLIKSGTIGMFKYAFGIDPTPAKLIRQAVCAGCEHQKGSYFKRCGICGCFILAKTSIKSEKCPLEKW